MDSRTLRLLEYDKVKVLLAEQAASSLGKARALALEPSADPRRVQARLADTTEARRLLESQGRPPLGGLRDVSPLIARARAQGVLQPEELLQMADFLRCARRLRQYLLEGAQVAPHLAARGQRLAVHEEIEREIGRCIDDNANVRRTASEELARLSARADTLERRTRERMEAIMRREAERGVLQEPIIVQRAGRFCLPVQANMQSRFHGIIQDRSDSGATVFMEPLEIVEIGNELRAAYLDMEAEVERILRALTALLGAVADPLEANLQTMGIVDFILAKGSLAQHMGATEPELVAAPFLRLLGARHPLLKGSVVPIDAWIGDEFDTLVITGPNTGGKTVSLKTVGLLALMTQSGLHIPADTGSQMTVWRYIYADIGDEQSIEQSLSTFSSHMTQIVKILNRVQAHRRNQARRGEAEAPVRALVLLDEIGAGTDPSEGAALGRAILNELHEAGCRTIATTHYNDLKLYAYATPGVENASVQFDARTLQPTFKLLIGQAGSSNAFDIAQRLGLPRKVVRAARSFLSLEQRHFEDVMEQVERQRRVLHEQTRQAESSQRELEKLRRRYEGSLEKLEAERRRAREEGFAEAEAIVRRAEEQARQIIAQLQRQPRQSRTTEELRRQVATLRAEVHRQHQEAMQPTPAASEAEPPAEEPTRLQSVLRGDLVFVPALGQDGIVVDLPRDGVAEVQVGSLRMEAQLAELQPPRHPPPADAASLAVRMELRKALSVPRQLDVRGMTVDEAIMNLEKYLDDVTLARFPEVRIIHGKGTGALRRGIHEFLRHHPQVRKFAPAPLEEGGEGATIVHL